LVLLLGCSKSEPVTGEVPPPTATAPVAPVAAVEPPEEKPVAITEDLVQRYLGYEKSYVTLLEQELARWKKTRDEVGKDPGVGGSLALVKASADFQKQLDTKKVDLLGAAHLSQVEADAVGGLANEIKMSRAAWKAAGGETTIAMVEEQLKAAMAKAPAAERTQMQGQLDEMKKSMLGLRDAAEAREKYGNEAVDLVLRHDAELAKLLEAQLALLSQMN
jgi:hypothetical protein